MPTGLCGESSCEGPWLSSSAGTAPGSSISRCTAAPSRCGRPPFPADRERDGVRPRPPQSSALRPQSRPLAPRQRLAVRGRAGHLPPAPGAARGAGRRGDPDPADDRIHAGAGEPACDPRLRRRTGGVLRAAAGRLRPSAPGTAGVRRWVARAARRLLAVAAHPSAGAVPENRRRSRLRLSPPAGAGSPRDHRFRRHARLPAAARSGRKHSAAARGGPAGAPAPVRRRPGGMLAAGVRLSPARQVAWEKGAARHRAAPGGRGVSLLLHRRPSRAGSPLGAYGEIPLGAERFDAERHDPGSTTGARVRAARSPYRAYRVSGRGVRPAVAALVRDPRSSMQIWSRHQGYPGDEWYLEFHKIRWPGGLKLWRVSGANVDLGGKRPYEPSAAHERAMGHASHFVHLLQSLAQQQADRGGEGIIVAPFDTELFGHWWFEGADFLAATYRALRGSGKDGVRAVTASQHHPYRNR